MIVDKNSELLLKIHGSTHYRVALTRPGKNAELWEQGSLPTVNEGRHQVVVLDLQHRPVAVELVGQAGRATPERKSVGPKPQVTLLYWVR